jgi:hypothetical protein
MSALLVPPRMNTAGIFLWCMVADCRIVRKTRMGSKNGL